MNPLTGKSVKSIMGAKVKGKRVTPKEPKSGLSVKIQGTRGMSRKTSGY